MARWREEQDSQLRWIGKAMWNRFVVLEPYKRHSSQEEVV